MNFVRRGIKSKFQLLDLKSKTHEGITTKEFLLSPTAARTLNSINNECHVISISGKAGTGKSTFLNLLITLFAHDTSNPIALEKVPCVYPFQVGIGDRSTTRGIDVYHLQKENKSYLFLDLEGGDDSSRGSDARWIYSNIITIGLGLSHIHLYNYKDRPEKSFMSFFDEITKLNTINRRLIPEIYMVKRDDYGLTHPDKDYDEAVTRRQIYENASQTFSGLKENLITLIPIPPKNIIDITRKPESQAADLYLDFENDFFLRRVRNLSLKMKEDLKNIPTYKSGKSVLRNVETYLDLTKKIFIYVPNSGEISYQTMMKIYLVQREVSNKMHEIEDAAEKEFDKKIAELFVTEKKWYKQRYQRMIVKYLIHALSRESLKYFIYFMEKTPFLLNELIQFLKNIKLYIHDPTLDKTLKETFIKQLEDTFRKKRHFGESIQHESANMDKKLEGLKNEEVGKVSEYAGKIVKFWRGGGLSVVVLEIIQRSSPLLMGKVDKFLSNTKRKIDAKLEVVNQFNDEEFMTKFNSLLQHIIKEAKLGREPNLTELERLAEEVQRVVDFVKLKK